MKKYKDQGKIDLTRLWSWTDRTEGTNPNVVALCADLVGSLKMQDFINENPDRFFQIGIAEANMMGIAAGLTIGGKIPLQVHLRTFLPVGFTTKFVNPLPTQEKMSKYVLPCRHHPWRRWSYPSNFGRYWTDENVTRYDGD